MIALALYTRPGCHLCDEMKVVIARVAGHVRLTLEEIDISGNSELEARYGLEIPVLLVEGKKAAKYRITEEDLRRSIRAAEKGRAG